MDWIITGLGNPGKRYDGTRHNAGFAVVDQMAIQMSAVWRMNNRFRAELAELGGYCLLKPQTFMNLSGDAVAQVAQFYKVPADHIVVVHDDLDIEMGQIKYGLGKGPKMHRGLQSVETQLGTPDFWRIRVGVEDRTSEEHQVLPGEKYVLMPLSDSEEVIFQQGVRQALLKVAEIVGGNGDNQSA